MAAGQGFKTFVTGDVLTAADTNGYLMQGVWVFANAAARTAAVTSPQEGNASFLKDTNALEIYDGAAWVAYGAGDITGVTAGTGISGGGTSGDVTITNSMATAIDAKGDLIAGTGADAFSRLAVGTNNQVLTADSSTATGLKWATPATTSFVGVSVSNSTNKSCANSTYVQITWDTEQYDTSSFHSTVSNTSRITMPSTGKYLISGISSFEANGTGARFLFYYLNGALTARIFCVGQQGSGTEPGISFAHVISFNANDYIEFYAYQTSGVSLNYQSGYPIQVTYLGA